VVGYNMTVSLELSHLNREDVAFVTSVDRMALLAPSSDLSDLSISETGHMLYLFGGIVTSSKNAIGEVPSLSCWSAQCAGTGGL
jgi:hypothetical protein